MVEAGGVKIASSSRLTSPCGRIPLRARPTSWAIFVRNSI